MSTMKVDEVNAGTLSEFLNGHVDCIEVQSGVEYLERKFHYVEGMLEQARFSLAYGATEDEAVQLAVARAVMFDDEVKAHVRMRESSDPIDAKDGDDTDRVVAALATFINNNRVAIENLRAHAKNILATLGQNFIKSGHHWDSQSQKAEGALIKSEMITLGQFRDAIIWHKVYHPVDLSFLMTQAFHPDVAFTVAKRADVVPAGYAWLGLSVSILTQTGGYPWHDVLMALIGNSLAKMKAILQRVKASPIFYATVAGSGRGSWDDAARAASGQVLMSEGDARAIAAVAVAYLEVFDRDGTASKSKSLEKVAVEQAGNVTLYKSAFRTERDRAEGSLLTILRNARGVGNDADVDLTYDAKVHLDPEPQPDHGAPLPPRGSLRYALDRGLGRGAGPRPGGSPPVHVAGDTDDDSDGEPAQ